MIRKSTPTREQLSWAASICQATSRMHQLEAQRRHCDAYSVRNEISDLRTEMKDAGIILPVVVEDLADRGEWGTFLNKYAHLMA